MKLFHISEEQGISIFKPRPSPQHYDKIKGNVVFAVNEKMLHNYLLPRDCPRVTFFADNNTSPEDVKKFTGNTDEKYKIYIEETWLEKVKSTKLYLYELPLTDFELLDSTAGYYISYKEIIPLNMIEVDNPLLGIKKRNAEIRISSDLRKLAREISSSTLQFSIIRLRNAGS